MINTITILGRLVKEAETKKINKELSTIKFTIAVNETDEIVSYFDCIYFVKSTGVAEYLTKGKQVAISGSLHQDRYTNKDGDKVSRVEIKVRNLDLISDSKTK